MRKFLQGSDAAYADLERQAKAAAYMNFPKAELPPGCVPAQARIGLQVDSRSSATTLYIERGTRYYGPNQTIRQWVEDGKLSFPDFSHFRRWICTELKNEFDRQLDVGGVVRQSRQVNGETGASPAATSPLAGPVPDEPAAHLDPSLTKVLEFLVKQVARNYGVEVHHIDPPLLANLRAKLRTADGQTACDTVVDDLLGGPFALASVEGHRKVSVHAGPPVNCIPIPEASHE